ncbi:MAG: DNA polymerase IV [Lachnospiraceae bacterium]|nr:DNA polymerase IV [Lachnospiraceae bacterium]
MKERIIFHVDVNSAFLSWEAVRRLREGDTLDLRTVPSAVGGDVKSRRGVITARSIPAKAFGVLTGEPVATALRKCPDLILVSSDFALYRACSDAFMAVCRRYTDLVEPFSIDECFMDVTDRVKDRSPEEAVRLASELKDAIRTELGFTVNVGVSENKLLAKTASDFTKPDRVHTLFREEIPRKFWPLPAGDLLFVGKSSGAHLKTLGIRTIGELAGMPVSVLTAHFGAKSGGYMHRAANGIDDSPVETEREDAKSCGNSTTLPYDLTTAEEAYPVLLSLSESVCRRMRKGGVRAGQVTVTVKGSDFSTCSKQRKLDFTTSASDVVYGEAKKLFDSLWDGKMPIRLLGVSCGHLSHGENEQMTLFGNEEREKREKLDAMLDRIREKFGKNAVVRTKDLLKPGTDGE